MKEGTAKKKNSDGENKGPVRRFLRCLGPGLVTGAADDDPSGIATYSMAGAKFGHSMLWTALLTWPLMACTQFMCARIGMVTGVGISEVFRKKFPRWLLGLMCLGLLAANAINIGADLSGMADAAQMLFGLDSKVSSTLFGVGIAAATVLFKYRRIADTLKWLALVLFTYIVTAFLVSPDWAEVGRALVPKWPAHSEQWSMLVAILGTTISPYLFVWQASQEVEEMKANGQTTRKERENATALELRDRKVDVGFGTLVSNLVMFFIILVTSLTLNRHGLTEIESTKQAAEALKPLAGNAAYLLFSVGVIGTGLLAIPTLAGSAAYAFAETFRWKQGLDLKPTQARAFYAIIVASTLLGVSLNFLGVNPIKALFWSAVVNGVLAPFMMTGIVLVAADRKLMKGQPSSRLSLAIVSLTSLVMFAAAASLAVL
ncbi:Nramp family divalent metal transporter [Luteolibacter ambystomatis]|uniref:Nramp family divalent metal transporter n=1 Tax=Luteolibacter ambystomatis TaxID=2824561 RepID=A0A975J3A0_9BACT|nr:Nramp family divalent metal transporter [Luteolibacter ambystomatis]QUE53208.1 Nramp family divalent metal transporter [Luteolibacter ambystomatis]